jgi:hypothetical protein
MAGRAAVKRRLRRPFTAHGAGTAGPAARGHDVAPAAGDPPLPETDQTTSPTSPPSWDPGRHPDRAGSPTLPKAGRLATNGAGADQTGRLDPWRRTRSQTQRSTTSRAVTSGPKSPSSSSRPAFSTRSVPTACPRTPRRTRYLTRSLCTFDGSTSPQEQRALLQRGEGTQLGCREPVGWPTEPRRARPHQRAGGTPLAVSRSQDRLGPSERCAYPSAALPPLRAARATRTPTLRAVRFWGRGTCKRLASVVKGLIERAGLMCRLSGGRW